MSLELCPACDSELVVRRDWDKSPFFYCPSCGEDYDAEEDE